jgi:5-methylcytosine-specific restriction endonuclease McrA
VEGGENTPENLVTVCSKCHKIKSAELMRVRMSPRFREELRAERKDMTADELNCFVGRSIEGFVKVCQV